MIAKTVTPGTTGDSLLSLTGLAQPVFRNIILFAPAGNTFAITYGSKGEQAMSLAAGATSPSIPIHTIKDFWVKAGDADDTVSVLLTEK
jgi:hypothetical protein